MSFLRNLFGKSSKLDGAALATSPEKSDYAQIELLSEFREPRPAHPSLEQRLWDRALPQPYTDTLALFQKQGWLELMGERWQATAAAAPWIAQYQARLAAEKAAVLPKVRAAIVARDTSEALAIRRAYEARQPLGKAAWTGPEPQLSHSALTRRILFLDHWLLDGLDEETVTWLKQYAAEQHMWGAYWQLPPEEVPVHVQQALTTDALTGTEAAYWKAHQLALYVDNQETWQRCKGGDHVRRLEIVGADDEQTCEHCRTTLGKQFLVARVPELPHRACTSIYGCRCRYEPVLESYEE
ncbi:MAG: hypothetical protein KDE19_16665 [Caldilineaceae bacterium]|nr:hypothetical protein [Caldilineaceae bacterium]